MTSCSFSIRHCGALCDFKILSHKSVPLSYTYHSYMASDTVYHCTRYQLPGTVKPFPKHFKPRANRFQAICKLFQATCKPLQATSKPFKQLPGRLNISKQLARQSYPLATWISMDILYIHRHPMRIKLPG